MRAVHLASFVSAEEADLVDALRESGDYVQSLGSVALDDGAIIGHVGFSRAWLEGADVEVLVLAPLAVLPERQRQGVGPELIGSSIERAEATDFPVVVVLGHRAYYPRFGFEPAGPLGIEAAVRDAARRLDGAAAAGVVAFGARDGAVCRAVRCVDVGPVRSPQSAEVRRGPRICRSSERQFVSCKKGDSPFTCTGRGGDVACPARKRAPQILREGARRCRPTAQRAPAAARGPCART